MSKSHVAILAQAYRHGFDVWGQLGIGRHEGAGSKPARRGWKRVSTAALVALLVVAAFSFMTMMMFNFEQIERLGVMLNLNGLGVFFAAIMAFLISFFYAAYTAGSTLYRATDLRLLITLPLAVRDVFYSRLLLHYTASAPLYWFVLLPGLATSGIVHGLSAPLVVNGLVLLALGPAFPLACSALFARLVSVGHKARSRSGHRFGELVALAIMIVLLVLIQGLTSRMMRPDQGGQFVQSVGAAMQKLHALLFYFSWQAGMVSGPFAWGRLALFIVSTAVLSFLLTLAASYRYPECVAQALSEVPYAKSKHNGAVGAARQGGRSPVVALLVKEFSIINSNSAFKMELYAEAGIPLILLATYAVSGVLGDMASMIEMVSGWEAFPFLYCGALMAMSSISMMSSTSISRESSLFELSKTFPVTPATHVKAKVMAHLVLYGSSYLIFLTFGLLVLKIEVFHLVWMIPLGLVVVTVCSMLGLAIDYSRPMLTWKLPQQAVKQNMNGIFGMLASVALLALLAALGYLALVVLNIPVMYVGVVLVAMALLCLWPAWRLVLFACSKHYGTI